MSLIKPSIGIVITSSTAPLTSIAILIMNENISEIKTRYIKLRVWINCVTLQYEMTWKQPMVDKKTDEKDALELKKNI